VTALPVRHSALRGQLCLDLGAAADAFWGWYRDRNRVGTETSLDVSDPRTFIRWVQYEEARILGPDLAEELDAIRRRLVTERHQRPEYEYLLVLCGEDVHQLLLKDNTVWDLDALSTVSRLLATPVPERWELLAGFRS
jgi:hypothetical protein